MPEDIEKDPNTFRGINNGWPAVISSLKSLLETEEPLTFSVSGSTRRPAPDARTVGYQGHEIAACSLGDGIQIKLHDGRFLA